MKEQNRLAELKRYKIMDTSSEQELDELVDIASAICSTPISLLTFIDDTRQWFKAKKGVDAEGVPREISLCQHVLHDPKSVLIIENPLQDERLKNNPLVHGYPHIRFYAGAPLETPNGNVIGTLCVIDNKAHSINEEQKRALMLLAKKVMDYLQTRNILLEQSDKIEFNASRLKKLTDHVPGAIFQFEMKANAEASFQFISKGIADLHPHLRPNELQQNSEMIFRDMHNDDLTLVKETLQESFLNLTTWHVEYRVISANKITWVQADANPEKTEDGTVVWYGTIEDITQKKEYIKALEEILFDISHVIRRPVTTMLGLANVFQIEDLNKNKLDECLAYIKMVAKEMDVYTKEMTEKYFDIRQRFANHKKTKAALVVEGVDLPEVVFK